MRHQKGSYSPSDTRKMNMLARLVDEQGVAYTAKLFAKVLQERFSRTDPVAATVANSLNQILSGE